MGKTVECPKKFIISCRVNDEEMQVLQEMAKSAGTNISNLMRLSLNLLEHDAGEMRLSA